MKKLVARLHWLLGISLGAIIAFSGLTGALMAFGPEACDYLNGGYTKLDSRGRAPLAVVELYARVQRALPDRQIIEITTYDDAARPARLRLAVAQSFIGPTAPPPETRMADPYTGELLRARPLGRAAERFVYWLHEVHQGHWGGPRDAAAWWGGKLVGLGAVVLLVAALSGLYLRWPRGRAARSWRGWLALDRRLKGRAWLWNLHAVAGTCAFVAFVISAHSGAFQNGPMGWYRSLWSAVATVPPEPRPEFGPRALERVPVFRIGAEGYFDADGSLHGGSRAVLDPKAGTLSALAMEPEPRTFGATLAAYNQRLHEGRLFGRAGTLAMALASLALPGFYITGWMMYLKRRAQRRRVAAAAVEAA